MVVFSIVIALLLEQLSPLRAKTLPLEWFGRYADLVARNFNAGRRRHGVLAWIAAIAPCVIVAEIGFLMLNGVSFLLGLAWNVLVLYFCLGLRGFNTGFNGVHEALRAGRTQDARDRLREWSGEDATEFTHQDLAKVAIEHGLATAHRDVFGVIAWFVLAPAILGTLLPGALGTLLSGPGGAVLYRLGVVLHDRWGRQTAAEYEQFGAFAREAFRLFDWVSVRLTALSFAIVGDFEDAVYCWRAQAAAWLDPFIGVVLSSGAGALGVRLGESLHRDGKLAFRPELGLGDEPDLEHMNSAVGLIWRTLVLWVLIIALMTVASWVA